MKRRYHDNSIAAASTPDSPSAIVARLRKLKPLIADTARSYWAERAGTSSDGFGRQLPTTCEKVMAKRDVRDLKTQLVATDPISVLVRGLAMLRLLSTPTDFAELEAQGLIQRDSDNWWRCRNPWALPESAAAKITEMESDCVGFKLRFSRPRLQKLRKEMEQFLAEHGIEVPPDLSPLLTRPPDDEKEEEGQESHRVEKGDSITVRSSNGKGCFLVRVINVARCAKCHAIILWARTDSGKRIPLDPWPPGFTVTRSHFPGRCPRRRQAGLGVEPEKTPAGRLERLQFLLLGTAIR